MPAENWIPVRNNGFFSLIFKVDFNHNFSSYLRFGFRTLFFFGSHDPTCVFVCAALITLEPVSVCRQPLQRTSNKPLVIGRVLVFSTGSAAASLKGLQPELLVFSLKLSCNVYKSFYS